MAYVYIVIENSYAQSPGGGVFPKTYTTFQEAKNAVIGKYKDEIDRQTEEGDDFDVPESKTGFTRFYIEKGINMYIHKLPVTISGGNRSSSMKSKTRKHKRSTR